jgi:protein SCO1/2
LFGHSIIGLTGKDENDEDFRKMLASFKIYANKIKSEDGSSYNIDHTSIVFLMDPQSQFIGSINPSKT